jgi:hypothetical protein
VLASRALTPPGGICPSITPEGSGEALPLSPTSDLAAALDVAAFGRWSRVSIARVYSTTSQESGREVGRVEPHPYQPSATTRSSANREGSNSYSDVREMHLTGRRPRGALGTMSVAMALWSNLRADRRSSC